MDLRSDVYALGVMLHQCLAGAFPYDVSGGLHTVLQSIVSAEPRALGVLPGVRGDDLSTVTLKALAKDPSRRYQSAGELAADLRSALRGEPIQARRDSTWYVLRRTMRRYRIAAGAGALVLVTTVAALVVSLRSLAAAREERDRAEAQTVLADEQRAVAENRTEAARAVTSFLGEVLMAADPGTRGKDLKLVEFLDPASKSAGERFQNQPESLVAVRGYLATAYRNLQMYDKSLEQAMLGLEVAERNLPPSNPDFVTLRVSLASTLTDMNRIDEARQHAQLATDGAIVAEGRGSRLYIEALSALAYANDRAGLLEAAESQRRELVELTTRAFGADSSEAISALGNLGSTLHTIGRLDEAIELLEGTIERARRHEAFVDAFHDVARDRANSVVILTGAAGDFIPGIDFASFGDVSDPDTWSKVHDEGTQILENIANIRVPMIFALEGRAHVHAEYGLLADLIVAGESATFNDLPHFAGGIVPGDGVFTLWSHHVGPGRARAMLLDPKPLSARDGLRALQRRAIRHHLRHHAERHRIARSWLTRPALTRRNTRIHFVQPIKQRIVQEVGYGLALEGASAAALVKQMRAQAGS
ncbi:tetratricopeptide repeat protein [Leptolyngbya sp. 15MV]|nr:tetratricopeptide repeat protein [Leptolyngbya sp. 15MV]